MKTNCKMYDLITSKKFVLYISLVLLLSNICFAATKYVNTATNDNISIGNADHVYVDETNDKIGIPTTTPLFELTIYGDVNATGKVNGSEFCIKGDCKTAWSEVPETLLNTGHGVGNATIWKNSTTFYNTSVYTGGSGKIGIGTSVLGSLRLNVSTTEDFGIYSIGSLYGIYGREGTTDPQSYGFVGYYNGADGYGGYFYGKDNGIKAESSTDSGYAAYFTGNVLIDRNLTVDTKTLHIDNSDNRIGIETKFPKSDLYVNGTISIDGYNVKDVRDAHIPQEFWGAETGFHSDFEEKVSATVFESATTYHISATTLTNGNTLIAYKDSGNNQYGTFVIYDELGNEVKSPTVFESAVTAYTSTTTFTNGNVLIAYFDGGNSGYGTFVIYDQDGTQIKSPTVFNSANTISISTTALPNGNVLIAHNGDTKFVIYDSQGNLIKSPTTIEGVTATQISATTLTNGNVLIAYQDADPYHGTFVIYDQDGNLIKSATVFESATTNYISAITLTNGNVLIAYTDAGNSNYGTFAIYNQDGSVIKSPTVFESATTQVISAITLTNGNVLIAYTDAGNSNYGTFIIYDQDGNLIKSATVFESAATYYSFATTLPNGNALIAYSDDGNSDYGTLVIYEQKGAIFDGRVTISGNVSNSSLNIYRNSSSTDKFINFTDGAYTIGSIDSFSSTDGLGLVINSFSYGSSTPNVGLVMSSYAQDSAPDHIFDGAITIRGYNKTDNSILAKMPIFRVLNAASDLIFSIGSNGTIDVSGGTLRINNSGTPGAGAGLELEYAENIGMSDILSYDRSATAYKDLNISASKITLEESGTDVMIIDDGKVSVLTSNTPEQALVIDGDFNTTVDFRGDGHVVIRLG